MIELSKSSQVSLPKKIHSIELKDSKQEISPFAHGVYLEAISKARELKYEKEKSVNIEESKESNRIKEGANTINIVNFLLSDHCPKCTEIVLIEEMMGGWKRSSNDYTTKCPYCTADFLPKYL